MVDEIHLLQHEEEDNLRDRLNMLDKLVIELL